MIYLILGIGILLRLILLNQSLWLDEAIGALVAKNMSYLDIITKFSVADNHPPLYYLVLRGWCMVFGYSEISLRMPSVLFGVGIIYLVYLISKKITTHNPLYTTLLVATSPFLIYYSQEARMYMMSGFFATLASYAFLNKKFLLFSISVSILAFTDYVPIFLLPIFIIYSIFKKYYIKETFLAFIPLGIVFLVWSPYFLLQLAGGSTLLATIPDWKLVAGGATFKQIINVWSKFILGRISLYNKWLYGLMVAISSLPFIYSLINSAKNRKNLFYWLWLLVPTGLCFIASFWIPAFIYFRFVFVIPAFYILLNAKNNLVFWMLIIVNIVGYSIFLFDGKQHREDWKATVNYIEDRINADEIVIFENPEPFAPYQWYEKRPELSHGGIPKIPATTDNIDSLVIEKTGVYYLEYLRELEDPNDLVRKSLIRNGFFEVDKKAFNGVGFVVHYIKKPNYAYSN